MPSFFKILGARSGRTLKGFRGKSVIYVTQDEETGEITVEEIAASGHRLGREVVSEETHKTVDQAIKGYKQRHNWWRKR